MFLANYSDGLTDVDLDEMVATSRKATRLPASSPSARPSPITSPISTRTAAFANFEPPNDREIWINGGYFIFRAGNLRLHARRRGAGSRAVHAA